MQTGDCRAVSRIVAVPHGLCTVAIGISEDRLIPVSDHGIILRSWLWLVPYLSFFGIAVRTEIVVRTPHGATI